MNNMGTIKTQNIHSVHKCNMQAKKKVYVRVNFYNTLAWTSKLLCEVMHYFIIPHGGALKQAMTKDD